MVWIIHQAGIVIEERGPCLFEGYAMLFRIGATFAFVPNEVYIAHIANVYTEGFSCQGQKEAGFL